jgi:IS605 OrfB family transposase
MFEQIKDTTAKIKSFVKNDWVWINVTIRKSDLFKRGVSSWKECNPKLVRSCKKYFLHFSYETNIKLNKTTISEQKICSVDLGITNSAVCSIMDANGTVLLRKFISHTREKDQMRIVTNKLKKAQRTSGKISAPRYWNRINGLQKHILNDTASQITRFAKEHNADVIVFEFLGNMNVPKGAFGSKRLRLKLHFWAKIGIQRKVEEMAHYEGIRISRINPRNTSKLAFDGSGEVKRNSKKDLSVFSSGKNYHADLNASYNIGARYFIREIQKSISVKKWLSVSAKVPELLRRTNQTLDSLITLQAVLKTS